MIHIFELLEGLEGLVARRACFHISDSQIENLRHFFKGLKISNDRKGLRDYAEEDRMFHHFLMAMVGTYNILAFSYHEGLRETGTSQCNIGVLEDEGVSSLFPPRTYTANNFNTSIWTR